MAGAGRRAGHRGHRRAAGIRPGPGAHRRPGAQRPARPGAVAGGGDRRRYVRREPAAPGAHAAAVWPVLGRRGRPRLQGRSRRRSSRAITAHVPGIVRLDLRPARHRADRQRGRARDRPGPGPRAGYARRPCWPVAHRTRSGEIVLGTSVLRLGRQGSRAAGAGHAAGRAAAPAVIVGRAVFPYFGQGSFTPTDLGEGAVVTAAMLAPQSSAGNGARLQLRAAEVRPRAPPDRGHRRVRPGHGYRSAPPWSSPRAWSPTSARTASGDYARIDATPEILAGVLAVLGLAVLAQFAMSSARRRRREFAILKTLGLLRRQLAAITAWQVTALTAAGPAGRPAARRGRRALGLGAVRQTRSACPPTPSRR